MRAHTHTHTIHTTGAVSGRLPSILTQERKNIDREGEPEDRGLYWGGWLSSILISFINQTI